MVIANRARRWTEEVGLTPCRSKVDLELVMTTVDNSVSNPGNVHIFGSKAIGFDFEQARVKNTRHSLMTWAGIRHGNQGPHVVLLET